MLLRTKNKQLTNVNIVTLKKLDRRYEVAIYPNKLYEYRHNNAISLDGIIHSDIIYKNISTGDICSETDLNLLRSAINSSNIEKSLSVSDKDELIRYILMNGHEQKAHETSMHELSSIEKQIVEIVQNKVTYNGIYVPKEILLGFIKKVWNIKNTDPKKQASSIIKKLEEIGFERISFKVKVSLLEISDFLEYAKVSCKINEASLRSSISQADDGVLVKSDLLPDFIEYCETKGLKYVLSKNEGVEEEEIC